MKTFPCRFGCPSRGHRARHTGGHQSVDRVLIVKIVLSRYGSAIGLLAERISDLNCRKPETGTETSADDDDQATTTQGRKYVHRKLI
jgi:hypothetical protein